LEIIREAQILIFENELLSIGNDIFSVFIWKSWNKEIYAGFLIRMDEGKCQAGKAAGLNMLKISLYE
jgi:hypothetical protein